VYFSVGNVGGSGSDARVYIEGMSPKADAWEPAEKYFEQYKHPLKANFNPPPRKGGELRGHGGHGRQTPMTWHLLVEALRAGKMPYFDVYDSVTSSIIVPLSAQSVAGKSKTVDVPDFTKGKWQTRGLFLGGSLNVQGK
jgi:hypothetical protein